MVKNYLHGWLRESGATQPMINDTAVRIRAGFLIAIPLFMAYTLLTAVYGSSWVVTGNAILDTYETDMQGRILYQVEAIRRTFDYSLQSKLLLYALFEMLAGMSERTAIFSPTIWIAHFFSRRHAPVWKPLAPKRFAWAFGATMVTTCLIFFNPDTVAEWINALSRHPLLPTTINYMPRWIPNVLVVLCVGFMWMEAVLGICAGCLLHAGAVRLGWVDEPCEACQQLDFSQANNPVTPSEK
ncbi:DUF4395 family protein [Undibacterium sp. Ji22W]|uniref:DUF4395 family protein n=1 Tax=Undibacterium sp. Ji22W TaxID=3413038 RepID=UPI003BF36405